MSDTPELLREKLRRLRAEHGMSRQSLCTRTTELGYTVPLATITLYETEAGHVPKNPRVLEVFAEALEVKPSDFYEYALSKAYAEDSAAAKLRLQAKMRKRAQRHGKHRPGNDEANSAQRRRPGEPS